MCWNGDVVSVAFALDCCDREAIEKLGLVPITTTVASPESSGMAESFVNTMRIDWDQSITVNSPDFSVSKVGQRILTNEFPPADQSKIGARLIQNWPRVLAQ